MLQLSSASLSSFIDAQSILDELGDDSVQTNFKAINTPRLAFIGMQSHGKSSTVEALIGMDILPKGRDTSTKGPLEIKILERGKQLGPFGDENWAKVEYLATDKSGASHRQSEEVTASELAEKLQEIGNKLQPAKGGLTDKPIYLELHIAGTVPLAFVDLPGLIFEDAQRRDVSTFIEKMWRKYCSKPETIIVLVHSAHEDYKANKAMQLAKNMDPSGERTLFVLTKVDEVEHKTAETMLQDKNLVAKLGVIGVINRSQNDLDSGVSLEDARASEEGKLRKALQNPSLAKRQGCKALAETLVKILRAQISKATPKIIDDINLRLTYYREERAELGEKRGIVDDLHSAVHITLVYSEVFRYAITGKTERAGGNQIKVSTRYTASTAIRELFNYSLPDRIKRLALELTELQIKRIIANATGVVGGPTFQVEAFKLIVQLMLEKFVDIGKDCVRTVHQLMLKEIADCINLKHELEQNMRRLPPFSEELMRIAREILDEEQQRALKATKELAEVQQAHISLGELLSNDGNVNGDNGDDQASVASSTRLAGQPHSTTTSAAPKPAKKIQEEDAEDEEEVEDDGHDNEDSEQEPVAEDSEDNFEENALMAEGINRITPDVVSNYSIRKQKSAFSRKLD